MNTFKFSAFTANQDGARFPFTGTLEQAKRKAKKYAKSAFPAWVYKGFGPTIVIDDAEGNRVVSECL